MAVDQYRVTDGSWLRLALKDVAGGGEIVGVSLSPSAVSWAGFVGCACWVNDTGWTARGKVPHAHAVRSASAAVLPLHVHGRPLHCRPRMPGRPCSTALARHGRHPTCPLPRSTCKPPTAPASKWWHGAVPFGNAALMRRPRACSPALRSAFLHVPQQRPYPPCRPPLHSCSCRRVLQQAGQSGTFLTDAQFQALQNLANALGSTATIPAPPPPPPASPPTVTFESLFGLPPKPSPPAASPQAAPAEVAPTQACA